MRISRLCKEANIGLQPLCELLEAMGITCPDFDPSTKIPDDVSNLVIKICDENRDLIKWIESNPRKEKTDSLQNAKSSLKIIGKIDLDKIDNPSRLEKKKYALGEQINFTLEKYSVIDAPVYDESNKEFWVEELLLISQIGEESQFRIGSFHSPIKNPLYSVVIGNNGVGKSTILKEIVDFFVDLNAYVNGDKPRISPAGKARLKGVKYHIDGVCCEVIRLGKSFVAKIDNKLFLPKELRIPLVVACNFGAFDKFPVQKVNGSSQTRYDVPCYKYVGAHVNGNMISSSAIAFRLLFALCVSFDDRQRYNITSILDFIKYDHKISLNYSVVLVSKRNGTARQDIQNKIQKDREYVNFSPEQRKEKVNELYNFYKQKMFAQKTLFSYVIDFDKTSSEADEELKAIYKLKQYDLVNSTNVVFYKQGYPITSDELSSGEFAMLAMILSVSSAAIDAHSLVLLDEPELSLHPNWQMTLIDNLDVALKNQTCHLMIATHSHMLVSDLPMNRSSVFQWEKDKNGNLISHQISENTYGWSAEEVLLKVFKTATDRNRYFGERIAKLLEQMGNNEISPEAVAEELDELQEISLHLSDVDPMKMVLNTIVEAYK